MTAKNKAKLQTILDKLVDLNEANGGYYSKDNNGPKIQDALDTLREVASREGL